VIKLVSITLTNAHRSVSLDFVTEYIISKQTKYPVKKIPDKQLPTIDPTGKTTNPRNYRLSARVTYADMCGLLSLESDRDVIVFADGNITDNYCFLDGSPECMYQVGTDKDGGHIDRPWLCRLTLISSGN